MQDKIKVAIVGTGSCAKSLVEGVQYYTKNPDNTIGLMYEDIGGYKAKNIQFVCGFDVDPRKINKPLGEALRAKPNCSMDIVDELDFTCITETAMVYQGPVKDGVADYMLDYPEDVSFRIADDSNAITREQYMQILKDHDVDVVINYVPVGSDEAADFYLRAAIEAKCHVVNCIPTHISTEDAKSLEQFAIDNGVTIVGSDMRSAFGASRLSEILQGSLIDSGLLVTQHIQENKACGSTQGQEHIQLGRTANTDFLNMSHQYRLKNKHISKENVLKGQNIVRGETYEGMTLFAGPSLTVMQKPGAQYIASDQKMANIDIIAYGFGGARYTLSAKLSVQDSPNSGGVVISAIRFCKVASEMGVVGYVRGASAWSQKSPPVQMTTSDAKFECDALARREFTNLTRSQTKESNPSVETLAYTFQDSKTDYE